MARFRKKPVVIEAIQWTRETPTAEIIAFTGDAVYVTPMGEPRIETLEGWLNISENDWIIKGIAGEFYPCKPDIFEATYEPVEEGGDE